MHIYFITHNYDKLCKNDVPGNKKKNVLSDTIKRV